MLEELKKNIAENNLFEPESKLLLAVSGGIDSMVMAHLFIRLGSEIGIAHCNFRLRGSESDGDEAFVRKFANKHGIPFFSVRFDTAGYAAEKGISIQMAARDLRYRWFEEIRIRNGYDFIVLAHNMNDNIETFLINLCRGTGLAGLTGMKPRFKKLLRPMLFSSRSAIEGYCRENRIKFREDRSNSDTKYTRNKIRHSILPHFRQINPSFDSTIAETAERLNEVHEIYSAFIEEIRAKSTSLKDGVTSIRLNELRNLSPKRTIFYEVLRPFGIGADQIDDLLALSEGKTGAYLITPGYRLIKNRNEILAVPDKHEAEKHYKVASLEELRKVELIKSVTVSKITRSFSIPVSSTIACLDHDKVRFPLIIRRWERGDYFCPLGMKSKKKLSNYFVDQKYSIPEKEKQLVLESDGKIAWVIGSRIDDRFRITDKSEKALVIRLK